MFYNEQNRFAGPQEALYASPEVSTFAPFPPQNGGGRLQKATKQDTNIFHGEALARDLWGEQYGAWIVLIFSAAFALFLIIMILAGQTPGKSFALKSISDILQFVGESIGFIFCLRIAIRLRRTTRHLRYALTQKEMEHHTQSELNAARTEVQAAQRAFLAWTFLAIAVASYAMGQAIWTSYDVRMNSADVPFPGLYDIGFVVSYPLALIGTLLLTRRNKATVGRTRLLLDALATIGTALAISWFFLLSPVIASLTQAPSAGAAFLSIYFPTGDLFLVAVGALLMFSPLSNREQQPVFIRLCLGLFFLAITDSLLAYYSLSFNFNTGTLQDVLWPLSMLLIGLAAIEYPHSVAREQEQQAHANSTLLATSLSHTRYSQLTTTIQTITPFILVLMTCAVLLTIIAPHGGSVLIQADIVALALIVIVVIRQALTLMENNRLTMQMRGELVISRRELQVTRREADEATRTAQEKRVLEEGIAALRETHARVARGDFAARASTIPGPLLPIAISLNLMLDRLSTLSQRVVVHEQLMQESRLLQSAVERLAQGLPAWPANQPTPQSNTELRPVFIGLVHLQRYQEGQWRRVVSILEPMSKLIRHLRDALTEIRRSPLFDESGHANFERMLLERAIRETDLLEQQQRNILSQTALSVHIDPSSNSAIDPLGQQNPGHSAHHLDPMQPYKEQKSPAQQKLIQSSLVEQTVKSGQKGERGHSGKQSGQPYSTPDLQASFQRSNLSYYQREISTEGL